MARIMTVPFVYQDKEWQTLITICRIAEGLQLRVNILNCRLAQQLASGNLFILKDGKITLPAERKIYAQNTTLEKSLRKALQEFVETNAGSFEQ